MQTSLDESKNFCLITEKVINGPILLLLQYARIGHIGMRLFNFAVLSVAVAAHNVPAPDISKTHLSNASLKVQKLELNWCSKDQSRKKGGSPVWGWKPNSHPTSSPLDLLNRSPSLHRGIHLPNALQSK